MQITDSDRVAIRCAIESQLQAFQTDDEAAAFALATPGIQATFKTPENFMEMVRAYYHAVYRPRAVVFENVALFQGAPAQPVLLLAPNGEPVRALYQMEQQPNGNWKINGCYLIPIEVPTI